MITKRPSSTPGKVLVTFSFPAQVWAETVHLVGDFNSWDSGRHPMRRTGDNPNWELSLELDANRAYQFGYLVNGITWCHDHEADDHGPDPLGSRSSVVHT